MTRRGLIVGLLISIALNFTLAGVLFGNRVAGQANALGKAPFGRLVETVPPEARSGVRAALKSHRFELLRSLREVRRARDHVQRLAAQHPVPEAELQQGLAEVRAATDRVQAVLHRALLEGLHAADQKAE